MGIGTTVPRQLEFGSLARRRPGLLVRIALELSGPDNCTKKKSYDLRGQNTPSAETLSPEVSVAAFKARLNWLVNSTGKEINMEDQNERGTSQAGSGGQQSSGGQGGSKPQTGGSGTGQGGQRSDQGGQGSQGGQGGKRSQGGDGGREG